MNEAAAREVLLVQAFETVAADSALWTAEDRAWASRVAREGVAADAPAQRFIAERAHHALQRLTPREPAIGASLAQRLWRRRWIVVVVLAALLIGAIADHIGSAQRINLLAPPVWAVLVWNLVAYGLLAGRAVAAAARQSAPPMGPLLRAARAALGSGATASKASPARAALHAFDAAWLRHAMPLSSARASLLLHAGAAALALGLIAGMYLRGLVLDYRAGWQSTFLDASAVHALLATLLAPAAALSGIAVPDAAALEALRFEPGSTAGARAAPWIHLLAITLALFVVLPRVLLALASGLRAVWLARRFPLTLGDVYFQRLVRERSGETAAVVVLPYAHTPGAQSALGLRALLASQLGDAVQVQFMPTIAFGDEDNAAVPAVEGLLVLLFDLAATPEPEHHGRLLSRVRGSAAQTAPLVLVDEAGFAQRFGAAPERMAQRRAAWRRWAGDTPVLFVDLDAPDVPALQAALRTALERP